MKSGSPIHIIIAPNAFKGSLSATAAAQYIAEGFEASALSCKITRFPIADGGDDTASLLIQKMQAEIIPVSVHDPIGRKILASIGWIAKDQEAILGLSDASGLHLLKNDPLTVLHAHTVGTGELMKAALDKGAQKIYIGIGGSATVDGGTGLLKALGLRYFDSTQNEIMDLPAGLLSLSAINTDALDKRLLSCHITVLCDVQNKLLGRTGAASVFGPQKGASEKDVLELEKCLKRWNALTKKTLSFDMAALKYGGAAGGAAAGLAAYAKARLVNGIDFFLNKTHFDKVIQDANLIITAEGKIDHQTLEGKGPYGVALAAKEKNIPVIAMAGEIQFNPSNELNAYFKKLISINPPNVPLATAIKDTGINLKHAACKLGNELANTQ